MQVRKPADLAVAGNGSSALPALITTNRVAGSTSQATITTPYDPLVFKLQSYDATTNQSLTSFIDAAPPLADGSDPYPGVQVRMTIDLPSPGLAINSYMKWDPSANSGAGGWFEFMADGNPNTYDNGAELVDLNGDGLIDQIRLTYTDGNPKGGDIDGLVNGVIQDPGMPVLLQSSTQSVPVTVPGKDVNAYFYSGALAIGGNGVTTRPLNALSTAQSRLDLGASDPNFFLTGSDGSAIGFDDLQVNDPVTGQASLYGSLSLVLQQELIDSLSDNTKKRIANKRLAYYGFKSNLALSLIYDPLKNGGAGGGARFYDRNGDGIADFLSLAMVDGGYGDYGTTVGTITNHSIAAVVDSTKPTFKGSGTTLSVFDAVNGVAPIDYALKATLTQRSNSVNQIGYVVIDPITGDKSFQSLFSSLAAGDATLGLPNVNGRFNSDREILMRNGQNVRFFETDLPIDQNLRLDDPRLHFLTLDGQLDGTESRQQIALSSTSGVKFQLALLASDQGLNALIGQEQGKAAVLDFSNFTGSDSDKVYANLVIAREASLDSITGFYRTLDAQGSVKTANGDILRPGDNYEEYVKAARQNMVAGLSSLQESNRHSDVYSNITIKESSFLAPMATVGNETYFAFAAASSDKLNHFKVLGTNLFGLEDLKGLGDRDYNDLVFGFNFAMGAAAGPI